MTIILKSGCFGSIDLVVIISTRQCVLHCLAYSTDDDSCVVETSHDFAEISRYKA